MRNSPLTTMLLAASAILVLGAVALCWLYLRQNGELRALQGQAQQLSARQQAVNALATDVISYSESHPDVRPILESIGLTNRANAKAPTK